MSVFKQQRSMAKAKITRVKTFIEAHPLDSETPVQHYEARLSMLDAAFLEFSDLHNKMVAELVDEEITEEQHEDYFIPVESTYLETKSNLHLIIQTIRSLETVQPHGNLGTQIYPKNEIKLPRLSLPTFTGDYSEWTTFFDLFKCTVDQNESLSGGQKLQYLKSVLKGEALQLIQHFSISDQNYNDAWEKLQQRYNKKKHIIYNFIKKFTEQPTISQQNASKLRQLTSTSDVILRGITSLGYDSRDPWIIYLLLQKLDSETQTLWSVDSSGNDQPTQEQFFKFLEKRCDALESCPQKSNTMKPPQAKSTKSHNQSKNSTSAQTHSPKTINSFYQSNSYSCTICSGEQHQLYQCPKFKEWDIKSRRDFINKNNNCYNCLNPNHSVSNCKNKYSCHNCKQRHHTLLHIESKPITHQSNPPSTSQDGSNLSSTPKQSIISSTVKSEIASPSPTSGSTLSTYLCKNISLNKIGILPTALVNAQDIHGCNHQVRVLLDSAAESSLITETCMQRLQLPRSNARLPVSGLASTAAGTTRGMTTVTISSRYDKESKYEVEVFVLPKLTSNIPSETLHLSDWDVLKSIHLADPGFASPGPIDIIIGTDTFASLLRPGLIDSKNGRPIVTNSVFGWILSGKIRNTETKNPINSFHFNVDQTLRKFWEIEEIESPPQQTQEEKDCESHFESTFQRSENGRYVVRLPFNKSSKSLGTSMFQAISRLKYVERRFVSDNYFMTAYKQFICDYIDPGHMTKIPTDEIFVGKSCYLPHHAVIKEASTSTKLRVVFDASSKTSTGISLNDKLLVGPTIQDDLFTTIVRFRTHKYAYTADIVKMYRQILVHSEDTDFQRIVWRESPDKPVDHYRLNTVTYGTSAAPYLATKTIQQVGKSVADTYPEAAEIIQRDFYVDDLMTGGSNLSKVQQLQSQIISILSSSGFELRKFASNNINLLSNIPETHREVGLVNLDDDTQSIKALGLNWKPVNDILYFQVHIAPVVSLTKRIVLSDASKLFDPLGLVAPTIVKAKIFLQELWLQKLDWDDELPAILQHQWKEFREDLVNLKQVKVNRWIPNDHTRIQLHGFCDASELAYAAVIYARYVDSSRIVHTNIITAKTKVAPLKQISIPRLELCGAVLLCKLMKKARKAFNHLTIEEYLWSDSMIVLSWLSSPPRRWQTFVANRTSEIIQSFPPDIWRHVKSQENPADLASRGISAIDLVDNEFWWYGPKFLKEENSDWLSTEVTEVECPEERRPQITALNNQQNEQKLELVSKYSCLNRLIRITAWCLRFLHNSRYPEERRKGFLTTSELTKSFNIHIKEAQQDTFHEEIKLLKTYKNISKKSKLLKLHPFLDKNGLLRVGGRLQKSNLTYESKHQIILSSSHQLTILLVRTKHIQYLHANSTLLSSILFQSYWIVGHRNLIKSTIHKCVICFRQNTQTSTQLMGDLPASRITPSRPFSHVGVDYAGPLTIRINSRRNSPKEKAYIALFICMSTKAIHLEAVTTLTSESFIACLKRFVSRRGYPSDIYSDNGTNFVGACRTLKEYYQLFTSQSHNDLISHFLTSNGTNWHFNPPSAPHFGGLWEAGVKSVKFHLKRILLNTTLNFEELSTMLTTIEACLNSRPLCLLSRDPQSPRALTPAHFLIGEELTAVPEPDLHHIQLNRLDRWQHVQKLTNDFWKRWSREYLSSLQPRNKWTQETINLKENDVVLVKEDKVAAANWILAIVKKTFPGSDGQIRVVTLQSKNKEFQRPIHKLCLLPIN